MSHPVESNQRQGNFTLTVVALRTVNDLPLPALRPALQKVWELRLNAACSWKHSACRPAASCCTHLLQEQWLMPACSAAGCCWTQASRWSWRKPLHSSCPKVSSACHSPAGSKQREQWAGTRSCAGQRCSKRLSATTRSLLCNLPN